MGWLYLVLVVVVVAAAVVHLLRQVAAADTAGDEDEWREMFGGEWEAFK